jgi:hypothetical protein
VNQKIINISAVKLIEKKDDLHEEELVIGYAAKGYPLIRKS